MSYEITTTQDESSEYQAAVNFPIGTIGFLKESGEVVLRTYTQLVLLKNPAVTYTFGSSYSGPIMRAAAPGFTVTLKVKA